MCVCVCHFKIPTSLSKTDSYSNYWDIYKTTLLPYPISSILPINRSPFTFLESQDPLRNISSALSDYHLLILALSTSVCIFFLRVNHHASSPCAQTTLEYFGLLPFVHSSLTSRFLTPSKSPSYTIPTFFVPSYSSHVTHHGNL